MLKVNRFPYLFSKYVNKPSNNKFSKPSKKQSRPEFQYLYGINPVQIAINSKRRHIHKLYIQQSEATTLSSRVSNIVSSCQSRGIQLEISPRIKLDKLCENQPHQHVVLKCSTIEYKEINSVNEFGDYGKLSVFVDKVTDTQNFGAIIRSCHFYGINKIIVNQQHKCPLNSTVSKTSAGALEIMDIYAVKGTTNFFQEWKKIGNKVVCTGMPRKAGKITYLDQFNTQDYKSKIMLVIGSEGAGVSPHLMALSDQTIMIRKLGSNQFPYSLVESLNVNAATCTILYQLTKSH